MKSIAFVISSLKLGGGAEKVCSSIGSKLSQEGYNIHYITFFDEDDTYPYSGNLFSFHENKSSSFFMKCIKLFIRAYKIKKYCKNHEISTCISFMEEANFSNILSKIIWRNNSRVIPSIRQSISAYGFLYKFLIKNLYNFSDAIITITKEEKHNLINNFAVEENKIQVIENPIDISKIQKAIDQKEQNTLWKKDIFTFIHVGRFTYAKNHSLLIELFQEFHKKHPNSQLLLIGDGELMNDISQQITADKSIHILGRKNNPYYYLARSDCFLFTSRYEGMPGVLLEALACGLPIISSDCSTGPKEILTKNIKNFQPVTDYTQTDYGILVPPGKKQSYLKAMEDIYSKENIRNRYQKKSQERTQDFQVENIIKKWMEIIL